MIKIWYEKKKLKYDKKYDIDIWICQNCMNKKTYFKIYISLYTRYDMKKKYEYDTNTRIVMWFMIIFIYEILRNGYWKMLYISLTLYCSFLIIIYSSKFHAKFYNDKIILRKIMKFPL